MGNDIYLDLGIYGKDLNVGDEIFFYSAGEYSKCRAVVKMRDNIMRLVRIEDGLLPCPFCGGKAFLVFIDNKGWKVRCSGLECVENRFGNGQQDAVDHWNRRVK